MKTVSYSFSLIRYVHDPAAEERLNIGVVVYSPEIKNLDALFDVSCERPSSAFAGFDGDHYRRMIGQFEAGLRRVKGDWQNGLPLWEPPADLAAVLARVWTDRGGSFRPGAALGGITENVAEELNLLYDRMILSQYRKEARERRTDEEVWARYRSVLPAPVKRLLKPKTFANDDIDITFDHTFRNGSYHALEPVSFDYAKSSEIQRKALNLAGTAFGLNESPEFGTLYLLLGPPQLEAHRPAYNRARHLLSKTPVKTELIEEDGAEDFARYLEGYMRQHDLLPPEPPAPVEVEPATP